MMIFPSNGEKSIIPNKTGFDRAFVNS